MSQQLLDSLNSALNSVSEKVKSDRPNMDSDQELLCRFATSDAIEKKSKKAKTEASNELKASLWETYTEDWWDKKAPPSNPKIEIKVDEKIDTTAIFQVKTSFKLNPLEDDTLTARQKFTQAFANAKFSKKKCDQIFDENLDIQVETVMRPLNELIQGSYKSGKGGKTFVKPTPVEASAGKKLLDMIMGKESSDLTAEEKKVCLSKKTSYVVKEGYMSRAVNYCKNAKQLRELLKIISPTIALGSVKFGQTAPDDERKAWLLSVFENILSNAE
jgi:hypothetical protein